MNLDEFFADAVAGVYHEVNGRISAISGLVQLGRMDEEIEDSLGARLEAEVERLEGNVRLMRELMPSGAREAEPIEIGDHLATATRLLRAHPDVREVEVEFEDEAEHPILAVPNTLTRALLGLLGTAIGLESGVIRRRLLVRTERVADGDSPQVRILVRGAGSDGTPVTAGGAGSEGGPGAHGGWMEADGGDVGSGADSGLASLVAAAGGRAREDARGAGWVVEFPGLPVAPSAHLGD